MPNLKFESSRASTLSRCKHAIGLGFLAVLQLLFLPIRWLFLALLAVLGHVLPHKIKRMFNRRSSAWVSHDLPMSNQRLASGWNTQHKHQRFDSAVRVAPEAILQPVQPWFVAVTLLAALMLNILPWGSWIWVPDWLALVLLFWISREPRLVGFGVAFILGLLMDVHNAVILGEHAFTYVVLAFAASMLSRRLPSFEPLYQTVQIWPVLLIAQLLSLTLRSFFGGAFPGWKAALISPSITAVLWPIALAILLIPQRKPLDTDVNRPL